MLDLMPVKMFALERNCHFNKMGYIFLKTCPDFRTFENEKYCPLKHDVCIVGFVYISEKIETFCSVYTLIILLLLHVGFTACILKLGKYKTAWCL